jgi:hypothetical protein
LSAPLRFLAVAILGWGAVRALSLGVLPGASLFAPTPSAAAVPPIVPTQFAPIEPPDPYLFPPMLAAAPPLPYGYGQSDYGYPPPSPYYSAPQNFCACGI